MPKIAMREVKTGFRFGVVSRLVTIYTPSGKRIRNPRWGQPESWNVSADLSENVKAAILTAIKRLKEKHLGTVVYVIQRHGAGIPHDLNEIFQAKWGTDGKPFMAFNGIAGSYWKCKLGMSKIQTLI